ncbi:hypothetical protein IDH44_24485 [Paenibacillus sp. IB182496]|uniref:Uncharacterized protein n=1 Tax=Paenibacillus sabuli TaxID=2772509 RepID=A0A927BWV2_9BACL|nr:hypothetical protein [Paenibacillus sabuli]MBD2848351.1 hypothetical protein [Paenibacillus sabuli]
MDESGRDLAYRRIERELTRQLEGEAEAGAERMNSEDDKAKLRPRPLPHRYEYRIASAFEPVAEETKRYREMAEELDDRYDRRSERLGEEPRKPAANDADPS